MLRPPTSAAGSSVRGAVMRACSSLISPSPAGASGPGWPRLARVLLDWVPPVVLAVAAGHELLYDRSGAWDWVLTQALVWPLILRRRAPVSVLSWTLALAAVCWGRHELFTAYLAVLFALHATAAYRSRAQAVVAAAVVEIGAVLVSIRFAPAASINDAVILLSALVMTFLLLGTTQRAQRQYLSVLEERTTQLSRELQQQAIIAAAEERRRIAREMHDIVAHSVSIMIALSEGAGIKAQHSAPAASATMRQVAATGREALAELRKVLSVLRAGASPELVAGAAGRGPQPTADSLQTLVQEVRAAGLAVTFTVGGDLATLPEALQINVFRIVQEGLTNALKHALGPTRAEVTVQASAQEVVVTVYDDGRHDGDAARASSPPGNGLIGMRERAHLFSGTVIAGPCPGRGWKLTCTLDPT
jgi:signal transduction histidine kinase